MKIPRLIKTKLFIFGGAAGVVGTAVLSSIAAIKTLRKMGYEIDEKIDPKEYVKAGALYYIPTGAAVGGTIFSLVMLNKTHKDYQKLLSSAYISLGAMYDRYRRAIRERCGEDTDAEAIERARIEEENDILSNAGNYKMTYYEPYSNQFFTKSPEAIIDAEYALNRLFVLRGYVSLKDFLTILDLEIPEGSEGIGWSLEVGCATYGYEWIDFAHELRVFNDPDDPDNAVEYYEIQYPFEPTEDYLD